MTAFSFWPLWLLLALDVASTLYAIRRGVASEANPLIAWGIRRAGVVAVLVLTHVALGYALWGRAAQIGVVTLWVITAIYALVVANNLRVLLKAP